MYHQRALVASKAAAAPKRGVFLLKRRRDNNVMVEREVGG
jgi:hypothetical protein